MQLESEQEKKTLQAITFINVSEIALQLWAECN